MGEGGQTLLKKRLKKLLEKWSGPNPAGGQALIRSWLGNPLPAPRTRSHTTFTSWQN